MLAEQLREELAAVAHLGPVDFRPGVSASTQLLDVVHDSRHVAPDSLFCAVRGLQVDGHSFIPAAIANGASALLVESFADVETAQIKVDDVRQAMPHAAAVVHGAPSGEVSLVGITGTNGKTTTTQLLGSIVAAAGRRCDVIGTLDGVRTTPESTELQRHLRTQADQQVEVVALEVSSHALDQHRVDALTFAVAAFSNLSPDHLNYHGDMQSYFDAKKKLFDGRAGIEVINVDDPWGARLADERVNARRISLSDIEIVSTDITGSTFVWRGHETSVPLPGQMNVANALMAAECAHALGIDPKAIATGLRAAALVPGRMELVTEANEQLPTVVVDYSHTPDSIKLALATLRQVVPATAALTIVFGCGGDRDRTKRRLMAHAAERGADRVFLTNDNPRTEDPLAIIADAAAGFDQPELVTVEPDRSEAIRRAIIGSQPGDVVLIAGKGHEKTQTIGLDVIPFDDVQIAREVLEALTP